MNLNKVYRLLLISGMALGSAAIANASGFQLFEQSGAGTGDYHAGGAAEANDASTEWYNPAGMVRLKHQQLSVGGVFVNTDIRFKGNMNVDTLVFQPQINNVRAQGGNFNFIPNMHYVAPINDRFAFGVGVSVPFGLKTLYSSDSAIRYAGTQTSVQAIDITPGLAFAFNKQWSIGAGLDIVHLEGIFDQYAGLLQEGLEDTQSNNKGDDWGYGFHAGILYQMTPSTRFGVAYHSQVVNEMKGTSKFVGPLAGASNFAESHNLQARVTLPPSTVISAYHDFNSKWSVMATATYTQWSVLQRLILNNVYGILNAVPTSTLQVVVQEHYHNTWNFALGAHYHMTQKWTLKAGVGYDESPAQGQFRNVQLPDANRIALSAGAHYQATKALGLDAGYTHLFVQNANINTTQAVGDETVVTQGVVHTSADVLGLQLTYSFI